MESKSCKGATVTVSSGASSSISSEECEAKGRRENNGVRGLFARSCPQTEMERLRGRCGSSLTHNSSLSSMDPAENYNQQYLKQYNCDEDDDVLQLNFNSPTAGNTQQNSRIIQPPVPRECFGDRPGMPTMHNSFGRGSSYMAEKFASSCPQTEMERLKARYMKETSSNLSQNSSFSSNDRGSFYQYQGAQVIPEKSDDSEEYEDVSLCYDSSLADLSVANVTRTQGPPSVFTDQENYFNDVYLGYSPQRFSEYFAQSCPQTEMERLKAYVKDASSSACVMPGNMHTHDTIQSRESYESHQLHQQQRFSSPQNIRRYDSDEDDDVLQLNFNSPTTGINVTQQNSRIIQPPVPHQYFGDRPGMPTMHNSFGRGSSYMAEKFASSCPQTEMERLKAQYQKEQMAHDNGYLSMQTAHAPSSYHSHSNSASFVDSRRAASLHQLTSDGMTGQYCNMAKQSPEHDLAHPSQRMQTRKSFNTLPTKSKPVNARDRDLGHELGIITINAHSSFSAVAEKAERDSIFDYIKRCKAQIILMNNTGLGSEEQLQIVRAEVKVAFPCESAMWASFGSLADESDEDKPPIGQGVIILVLGPLAPRTGWIKSDSTGCAISASARIKPTLPVLTFMACDFGGVLQCSNHPSIKFLSDLVDLENEKENVVVVGGNLGGKDRRAGATTTPSVLKLLCDRLRPQDVNLSVICDSNSPRDDNLVLNDVFVCQKKKSMSILDADVYKNSLADAAPCLLRVNVNNWPRKSFSFQAKNRQNSKVEAGNRDSNHKASKSESFSRASPNNRRKVPSGLLHWQKNLQDFSHNLQGILRASMDTTVKSNCLKQLLSDILNRVNAEPSRIDCIGYANTPFLKQLSSLLTLPEAEFALRAPSTIEHIISNWLHGAAYAISSMEAS